MTSSQAIVLIGMPGAGKTTVGAALAQLMQWGFVDVDDVVAAEVGDIPTYIETHGIDAFRAQESAALDVVTGAIREGAAPAAVVAVGGGAILAQENRIVLAATGPVVWLHASIETLLDHVGDGSGRPLLVDGAEAALRRLLDERGALYAQTATVAVAVDGRDPNVIAVAIVKALAS
ncbi:MAG: shikimate kinase [Actinobacteria bacterium]|nr:shikimate kinase [Actinomycetota bacterium]